MFPKRQRLQGLLAVAFALAVWQGLAVAVASPLLLASPGAVLARVGALVRARDFWPVVFTSLSRVAGGFFLGALLGLGLSVAAFRFSALRALLAPWLQVMKAVPVASFVILALLWLDSRGLVPLIALMMVLPPVYHAGLAGLEAADPDLLSMCRAFGTPFFKRVLLAYVPGLAPFLLAACRTGLGMAWKAGIAAEVIGLPTHSIGEKLYEAKVYLQTADLFAWTLIIIAFSVLFEKTVMAMLTRLLKWRERA